MSVKDFTYNVLGDKLERNKIHFHTANTESLQAKDLANVPGGYDLIYIDGSHDFMPVVKDFKNAVELISPTGWIIFDDYKYSLPGVRQAIDTFVRPKYNIEIVSLCGHVYGPTPEPDEEGHVILRMDKQ
jgi:predicted O-methyltransferase YrrM